MSKLGTILVTGSAGQLGQSIQSIASDYPEYEFVFASRQHLDLSNEDSIANFFGRKSFDIIIKTPPAAVQLKEAAKIKSGSAQPNRQKVASLTWDQVKVIAEDKMKDLNCFTVESAMKLIAGTARSMGITVKGDFPGK